MNISNRLIFYYWINVYSVFSYCIVVYLFFFFVGFEFVFDIFILYESIEILEDVKSMKVKFLKCFYIGSFNFIEFGCFFNYWGMMVNVFFYKLGLFYFELVV